MMADIDLERAVEAGRRAFRRRRAEAPARAWRPRCRRCRPAAHSRAPAMPCATRRCGATLKPFQPSLIRPSGSTSASAAPSAPAAERTRADDHRRTLGLGERVRHRLGQLAEQLEIVAEPLDLHAEIDLGPDREHLAALARDLAHAGGDQRRFPADVRADQQDRRRRSRCRRWSS